MATAYKGTAPEVRALNALITLMRASAAVESRLEGPLADRGLSQGQLGVLEALLHLGPLYQRELARRLLRSPANITAVIDALEEQGQGRRERGEGRRLFTIHLPGEGGRRDGIAFPCPLGAVRSVVRPLPA